MDEWQTPAISVIIPETFDDPRSDRDFLRAWVEQSCDQPFELLVVASRGHAAYESEVKQILRAEDRLLIADLQHEMDGYAVGVAAARGEWIFVTENHVRPHPDCLRMVTRYLQSHAVQAAVVNSESIHSTRFARLEGQLFTQQMELQRQNQPPRVPLQLRGSIVRRDVYLKHGGLPTAYKTFATNVLQQRLTADGVIIHWIDEAKIGHVNCGAPSKFAEDIRDTTYGECIFAAEPRPQHESPVPLAWRQTGPMKWNWRLVGRLLATAIRPARPLSLQRRWQVARRFFCAAVRQATTQGVPVRWRWLIAHAACRLARSRFALTRAGSNAELNSFIRFWKTIVALARLEYALGCQSSPSEQPQMAPCDWAFLRTDCVAGFHAPESYQGRTFRWSEPIAELLLASPAKPHRVVIDTQGLRSDLRTAAIAFYINDCRVPPNAVQIDDQRICVNVSRDAIREDQPMRITIVAEPIAEARQLGAPGRQLGLPFFDVRIKAASLPEKASRAA